MKPSPAPAHTDARPLPTTTVVTGAAGWLGRALTEALAAEGRHLRCLVESAGDVSAIRGLAPAAEVVVGDVRDPVALDRLFAGLSAHTVMHTAAVIHPRRHTREFFDVNVGGT